MQLGKVALAVPAIDHLTLFRRRIENDNFYCSLVNIFSNKVFLDRIIFSAHDHYTKIKSNWKFKIRKYELSKFSLPMVFSNIAILCKYIYQGTILPNTAQPYLIGKHLNVLSFVDFLLWQPLLMEHRLIDGGWKFMVWDQMMNCSTRSSTHMLFRRGICISSLIHHTSWRPSEIAGLALIIINFVGKSIII